MKVLQILGDSAFGGGTYQVLSLCKFLQAHNFDVSLLSTDETTKNHFMNENIKVVSPALIKATVSPYRDLSGLIRLKKYLQYNRFDIVHTHTSKAGFIGRLAAYLAGIPIIIHTVHGYAFDDGYRLPKRFLFKYLERKAGKWSDLLITISDELFDITIDEKISPASRVVLIENGVDWQKFKEAKKSRHKIRKQLKINEEQLLVGMISRLSRPKIPEDFVNAANELRKQKVNARYLLVGNGPLQSKVEKLIKELKLENKFFMMGFKENIPEILSAIDVFVLPTLWEGRSMALLEAMAAGKAIVATDIPANRELLENGKEAILIPVRDVEKLTDAICELARNSKLAKEMGKAAQEKVIKKYAIDSSLRKILSTYNLLIKKAGIKDTHEAKFA